MGVFLSAFLLIVGGISILYGVHFYRAERHAGYFRFTLLLLGILAGIWQMGFGMIGLVDDFVVCGYLRRLALVGVCVYPLEETMLALRMAGLKRRNLGIIASFLSILCTLDWIFFSNPKVDEFLRVGNWTVFRALDAPARTFHNVCVAIQFSCALLAWILWYKRVKHKREKTLMYGILVANLAIMLTAFPDTFLVSRLSYSLPTSGIGAGLSLMLWYIAAERYNTFSISSRTMGLYARKVLNDGIVIIREDRRIIEINDFAHKELGFEVGQLLSDVLVMDLSEDELYDTFKSIRDFRFKCTIKDRPEVYSANMRVALDNYNEPYGYIVSLTDITKEEELVIEAESSNRAKSNFLANISHEIRTPMNAIMGMSELIVRDSKDEEAKENAQMITSAARSLLYIINDILDFSKIESGKMEIVKEKYQPASMINDVVTMIRMRLDEKPVKFTVNVDPMIPRELKGDEVRIKQVLINLLGNAVKFTKFGEIRLSITHKMISDEECRLDLKVSDTGIGIKEEDLGKIFDSFTQVDAKRSRAAEGTGLGLSISKQLSEAMGGDLTVSSVYKQGSEFSFYVINEVSDPAPVGQLWTEAAMQGSEAFVPDFKDKDAKILVVDDNDMNIKVFEGLLKAYDISPVCVNSGVAAIRCYEKLSPFDMIFMDHMMPGMDGVEAAGKIRELAGGKDVCIVALTANAVGDSAHKYLEAGFDAFLGKPVEAEKLDEILRKFLPVEKMK